MSVVSNCKNSGADSAFEYRYYADIHKYIIRKWVLFKKIAVNKDKLRSVDGLLLECYIAQYQIR